ncbi:hypothetical protein B0T26DRAFT_671541 [Lasiosphaeria miniovina]|uniref:Uncharacterized protein n=1 Tax=Lasiosphaeria miniovina TaxID=1954250 RepID=A0AA40E8Y1_9PEZI|nr:uncharacterized protein B0T26DRAFT_671541 [Lasiosphaeria miniovina]KAK0726783.1 hypothetical protein B0T26DRAFT_671541 [Lasiosphaeria miniovina]
MKLKSIVTWTKRTHDIIELRHLAELELKKTARYALGDFWFQGHRCDACINDLKNEQTMQIGLHINKLEYQIGYNTALVREVIKEMCKFFDEEYEKRLASLMASSLSAKNTWEQAFAQISPTQPLQEREDLIRGRDMRIYINYDAFNAQMIRIAEDAERFALAKIKLLHTSDQRVLREEIEEIEGRYNRTSPTNASPDDKNIVNNNADGNGNRSGTEDLYPRVADRYGFYDYLAQGEVLVQYSLAFLAPNFLIS